MKPTIVRRIKRADADAIGTLGNLGVATIHEAQGRTGLMRPYMRPIFATAKVAGSAITVSCQPGDNLMIHAALDLCQAPDVTVERNGLVEVRRGDGHVAHTGYSSHVTDPP